MSSATTPAHFVPLRVQHPCGKETCSGELVALETAHATEVYIRCAPALSAPGDHDDFESQARRFYGCLPRLLGRAGADVSHVVLERVFFEDFARDMDAFQKVRAESYYQAAVAEDELPATTYIQQPPCRRTQKLEMQIYAVVPKRPGSAIVRTEIDAATGTTAKLLEIAGVRHLYIADINGLPDDRAQPGTFREQSDRMFARCRRLLQSHGVRFPDVLRTWCYLDDIDHTYADFNHSRNAFFAVEGVKRLPASTGIEARLWPLSARCAMDLYAVLNPDAAQVEVMTTPTLNEASEYGSSFARGMKVDLPDKTVLFISGTASIDERGVTVHVGDVRRQLERMLLNIQELLAAQGASFADLAQAATFLKRSEYMELCELVLEEWGIRDVPNTFVQAGVCRPELLCEMEAVAVLPKG
jgi:enamine deaminase RidA (YjgF/YER057c/UK114 family)